MRRARFIWSLALLVAACSGDPVDCETDLDCTDGFDCTTDVCGVGGECRNAPVDDVCGAGQRCVVGTGCVAGGACASNEACDDGLACTNDVCGVGGVCMNMPLDERCAATERCDPQTGCVEDTGCDSATECDDGVACTSDACGADRTCRHTPVNEMCDTANMEVCLAGVGCEVIIPCAEDDDCQDGDFCNGLEVCNAEFGCMAAPGPSPCSDGDDCTVDSCDPTLPGEGGQMGACRFDCDDARAECMCPAPAPTCEGTFDLVGATGGCLSAVTWDFSTVTFTNVGGAIQVTGWTVLSSAPVPAMGDPGPACPNVDAGTGLPATGPASCGEEYRIRGTFLDANTFEGTFTASFSGNPGMLFNCSICNQTVPIRATRR